MGNLDLWDKVRSVPKNAQKEITGGRLKGKTDINPMWRIKTLTDCFGVCGVGWKYEIKDKRLERGGKDEIAAFVDIDLYIKINGEWSEPIPGTGGSMFVEQEKSGPHTNDECFKMALTDAISVACKALGVGADVYWHEDVTKYLLSKITKEQARELLNIADNDVDELTAVLNRLGYKSSKPSSEILSEHFEDVKKAVMLHFRSA